MADTRFKGNQNTYVDIAIRGQERLGIDLEYLSHAGGSGLLVRLVVHAEDGQIGSLKHFVFRDHAKFVTVNDDGSLGTQFKGARLNKFLLRLFKGYVPSSQLLTVGDQFNIWNLLAGWVREQFKADGFMVLTEDLPGALRSELIPAFDASQVALQVEFPDLAEFKAKVSQKQQSQLTAHVEDDDDEDDEPQETIN